jgi:hypothetical protein
MMCTLATAIALFSIYCTAYLRVSLFLFGIYESNTSMRCILYNIEHMLFNCLNGLIFTCSPLSDFLFFFRFFFKRTSKRRVLHVLEMPVSSIEKTNKKLFRVSDIRMQNYVILITFKMHQIVDLSYTTQRKCYS